MQLDVDRSDLHHVRAVARPPVAARCRPGPAAGRRLRDVGQQRHLRRLRRPMRYWDCFPGPEEDGVAWGRVPVWGFGDVVESTAPGVAEGTRVYGYFPLADELVVTPGRIDDQGFSDTTPSREAIPSVYARYAVTDADRVYRTRARGPADAAVAPVRHLVRGRRLPRRPRPLRRRHGGGLQRLVQDGHRRRLPAGRAGRCRRRRPDLARATPTSSGPSAATTGPHLRRGRPTWPPDRPSTSTWPGARTSPTPSTPGSATTSATRWWWATPTGTTPPPGTGRLPGPSPEFLFAPDQIAKRRADWGRDGFEAAVAGAWEPLRPLDRRVADAPPRVRRRRRSRPSTATSSTAGSTRPSATSARWSAVRIADDRHRPGPRDATPARAGRTPSGRRSR